MSALTSRQKDVMLYVLCAKVVGSGGDGTVLRALEHKGLVRRSHNSAPGYVYYTWSLTDAGTAVAKQLHHESFYGRKDNA